jgi:hypothetical protein
LDNERVFRAGDEINDVSDFAILLLPTLLISRLQMPLKKKIGRFGHLRNMFIAICRQLILMGGILTLLSGCGPESFTWSPSYVSLTA